MFYPRWFVKRVRRLGFRKNPWNLITFFNISKKFNEAFCYDENKELKQYTFWITARATYAAYTLVTLERNIFCVVGMFLQIQIIFLN